MIDYKSYFKELPSSIIPIIFISTIFGFITSSVFAATWLLIIMFSMVIIENYYNEIDYYKGRFLSTQYLLFIAITQHSGLLPYKVMFYFIFYFIFTISSLIYARWDSKRMIEESKKELPESDK